MLVADVQPADQSCSSLLGSIHQPMATLSPSLTEALVALSRQLEGSLTINSPAIKPPVWNTLLKSESPVFRAAVPCCYAAVKSSQDVVLCVSFAVAHHLPISARGSGHHYGGACLLEGGMVIDMSQLKRVCVDPVKRTATLQPGVTTRELREATCPHGLHFPSGHISDVGCSGYILGGGNGWGVTLWGAAVDNVDAFEVVLPTQACQPQMVSHATDPDLFAGLKGAGAFLGIVTEFHVQLHPVAPRVPVITAIYPASLTPQVAALHTQLMASAPSSVEVSMAFVRAAAAPHDPCIILGATAFAEPDDTAARQAFEQIRQLLPDQRLVLHDAPLPYLEALSILDGAWEWPGLCLYGHGMFVEKGALTPELLQELEAATSVMGVRSLILICPGAPPCDKASSLDFRGGLFLCVYAMWPRTDGGPAADSDQSHVAWVGRVKEAVGAAVVGLYVNEVMLDQPGQVLHCYKPSTLKGLQALKTRTDPHSLLRKLQ